jgi:hypothetical protein
MNTATTPRAAWPPQSRTIATAITILLALLALATLLSTGLTWAQRQLDDLRYGSPRTVVLAEPLGFDGDNGLASAIIATNLDGQVALILLPASDPALAMSLPGPYLFGTDGRDEVPHLALADRNNDGRPDLVLTVCGEQVVYLHRGDTFSLLTPAERAAITIGAP